MNPDNKYYKASDLFWNKWLYYKKLTIPKEFRPLQKSFVVPTVKALWSTIFFSRQKLLLIEHSLLTHTIEPPLEIVANN